MNTRTEATQRDPRRTAVVGIATATILLHLGGRALLRLNNEVFDQPTSLPWYAVEAFWLLVAAAYVGLVALVIKNLEAPLTPGSTAAVVAAAAGTVWLAGNGADAFAWSIAAKTNPLLGFFTGTLLGLLAGCTFAIVTATGRPSHHPIKDGRRLAALVAVGVASLAVLLIGVGSTTIPSLFFITPNDDMDFGVLFAYVIAIVTLVGAVLYAVLLTLTVRTRNRHLSIGTGALVALTTTGTMIATWGGLASATTYIPDDSSMWPTALLAVQALSLAAGAYFAVIATTGRPRPLSQGTPEPLVSAP